MAAPAILRTPKFLTALAYAPIILSTDFVDTCLEKNKFVKMEDFLLNDKTNEKSLGLKLKDSLAHAKANRRNLLRGVAIFCTDKIQNGPSTYRKIAEVNGGTFTEYTGRAPTIKKPTEESQDQDELEPVYLLSGTKPEEMRLWPKFVDMAKKGRMEPRIVKSEWLLDTTMFQRLKWDEKYLVDEAQS